MKPKKTKYGGTFRPTYKFLPLAFSTCGDQSPTVHTLVKELGNVKAEMQEDYLGATDQAKLGIFVRETGRLRRRLSLVLQKALAYRMLKYVERQTVAERWHRTPGPTAQADDPYPMVTKRARV